MKNIIIAISLLISLVECFNFDIKMPIYKSVVSKTSINNYFGYSVAQHYFKTNKTYYVIVGAPKSNYQNYNSSGAIYRCPITFRNDDCNLVDVNFKPDSNSDEYSSLSPKRLFDDAIKEQAKGPNFNDQWFGVSLASTGTGQFSACAHRYSHSYNFTKYDEFGMYGSCYIFSNSFVQEYKLVPCLQYTHKLRQYDPYTYNYMYCQTGTSLHLEESTSLSDQDSSTTFLSLGMPTALNFRGLPFVVDNSPRRFYYIYEKHSDICGFKYSNDYEEPIKNNHCDKIWSPNSYLGMSNVLITNKKSSQYLVISGAPRENLTGVVHIFTMYTESGGEDEIREFVKPIKGPAKGSYFGYSMSVVDINGDRLKDLIVGAPYYSESKFEYDKGAIYVYMQVEANKISPEIAFSYYGKKNSRFGTSISSLGDIDNDSYSDFAVGAPHEVNPTSSSSTGAVYIFRGANDPKNIKLSQIIYAESFLSNFKSINEINYFGSSLSGGLDFDANGYPDLVIGSFKSNHIFILRTYPIINIIANITNLARLQDIDQTSDRCDLEHFSKTNESCFSLDLCFQVLDNQRNKNIVKNKLPIVKYVLNGDSRQQRRLSRVLFVKTNTDKYESRIDVNNKINCEKIDVILNSNINDYLTPIKFAVDFNFDTTPISENVNDLNEINKYPIVNQELSKSTFEAKFKRECGDDLKCMTTLKLEATFENLTRGDDGDFFISYKEINTLVLHVTVDNSEEPSEASYGTVVNIKFDERLDFAKLESFEEKHGAKIECALNSTDKSHLICSLTKGAGLPFPAHKKADFLIKFGTFNLTRYTHNKLVKIDVDLKTLSVDLTPDTDNFVELTAKLVVNADFQLYSKQTPEQVFYDDQVRGESAMRAFNDIGPIIEHVYSINNLGPFTINYFRMKIYWPFELKPEKPENTHGKRLLYLTEKPRKIPNNHPINVICDDSSYAVDPLKIGELSNSKLLKRSTDESESMSKSETATESKNDSLIGKLPNIETSPRRPFIDCFSNTAQCYVIKCDFYGELDKDETIQLKFIARLWNSTLAEDFKNAEKVIIASTGELILNDTISENKRDHLSRAMTIAYSDITVTSEAPISIWVYIGSALGGVVLLGLCIFAFWMLGFFERKKFVEHVEESEKLRQQGDH